MISEGFFFHSLSFFSFHSLHTNGRSWLEDASSVSAAALATSVSRAAVNDRREELTRDNVSAIEGRRGCERRRSRVRESVNKGEDFSLVVIVVVASLSPSSPSSSALLSARPLCLFFFAKLQNVPFSVGAHAFINNTVPFKTSPLDEMDNTFLLSYAHPAAPATLPAHQCARALTHTHTHTRARTPR